MQTIPQEHKDKMKMIRLEILNVCWCHGCGCRKNISYNYVGSFCSKWCWRGNVWDADIDDDDTSWCVLGKNCMSCINQTKYTLRKANHICSYYNLDPMGAKDKKYTKNAKPCIKMDLEYSNVSKNRYQDLVGQY